MSESIKQILIRRDKITSSHADQLIDEARNAMFDYLDNLDDDAAENVCMEYFGLEPDYITELL